MYDLLGRIISNMCPVDDDVMCYESAVKLEPSSTRVCTIVLGQTISVLVACRLKTFTGRSEGESHKSTPYNSKPFGFLSVHVTGGSTYALRGDDPFSKNHVGRGPKDEPCIFRLICPSSYPRLLLAANGHQDPLPNFVTHIK